jgi:hypothetical protein
VSGTTRFINLFHLVIDLLGSLLFTSLWKPVEVTSWCSVRTEKPSAKGGGRKNMSVLWKTKKLKLELGLCVKSTSTGQGDCVIDYNHVPGQKDETTPTHTHTRTKSVFHHLTQVPAPAMEYHPGQKHSSTTTTWRISVVIPSLSDTQKTKWSCSWRNSHGTWGVFEFEIKTNGPVFIREEGVYKCGHGEGTGVHDLFLYYIVY